jgi:ubiquinone/menaquinone biosynthesis C-methylase UbiE
MNVDPIARVYRSIEYAAFGRSLERCRFASLPFTTEACDILILGEGDGRFLERLLRMNDDAIVDSIDVSARMLELARQRVAERDLARVRFQQRDALDAPAGNASYDLIITNFFLDCFSPESAAALIAKWSAVLKPGGLWLVGEFNEPDCGFRRFHARLWHRVMYWFFQLTTGLEVSRLPPYAALLHAADFTLVKQSEMRFGLMISQVWRKNSLHRDD